MNTARCTRCGFEFPATTEYFHKVRNRKASGLHSWCKKCHAMANKHRPWVNVVDHCFSCGGLTPAWSARRLLVGRAGEPMWQEPLHVCAVCDARGLKMAWVPKTVRKRNPTNAA